MRAAGAGAGSAGLGARPQAPQWRRLARAEDSLAGGGTQDAADVVVAVAVGAAAAAAAAVAAVAAVAAAAEARQGSSALVSVTSLSPSAVSRRRLAAAVAPSCA